MLTRLICGLRIRVPVINGAWYWHEPVFWLCLRCICTARNNGCCGASSKWAVPATCIGYRIDRYYSSDVTKHSADAHGLLATRQMYLNMENPSENPKVTFQPMMCQHCNHAPLRNSLPGTGHQPQHWGLNMMTNRCRVPVTAPITVRLKFAA